MLDCNVLAAANGMATHLGDSCQAVSADQLVAAARGLVVLDQDGVILDAYRAKTSQTGQPGPAELFYRWLLQVKSDRRHVRTVHLAVNGAGEYSAYPRDPEFATFDRDDRVYVATAVASGLHPNIVNATDTDWLAIEHALERHGIRVRQICEMVPTEEPDGHPTRPRPRRG